MQYVTPGKIPILLSFLNDISLYQLHNILHPYVGLFQDKAAIGNGKIK
jgi:hypothetical protein